MGGALCKEEVSGVGGEVEEDEEGEEETGAAGQSGSRSKCAGEGQHLVNKIYVGFFILQAMVMVSDNGGGVELTQRTKDKAGPPIVGRMMASQIVAVSSASPG